jgi:hypothetical protein
MKTGATGVAWETGKDENEVRINERCEHFDQPEQHVRLRLDVRATLLLLPAAPAKDAGSCQNMLPPE